MISLNSPWLLKQCKTSKFWTFIQIKFPFISVGNLLNFGRQRGPRTNSTLCDFYIWASNSTSCLTQTTTVILPLLSSGLAGSVCFVETLHTVAGPTPLTHAGSVLQKLSSEAHGMSGHSQSVNWNTATVFSNHVIERPFEEQLCFVPTCVLSRKQRWCFYNIVLSSWETQTFLCPFSLCLLPHKRH